MVSTINNNHNSGLDNRGFRSVPANDVTTAQATQPYCPSRHCVCTDCHGHGPGNGHSRIGSLLRRSGSPEEHFSIMMQCVSLTGLMSVIWLLYGYSTRFCPRISPTRSDSSGVFDFVAMNGVLPTNGESGQTILPSEPSRGCSHFMFQ